MYENARMLQDLNPNVFKSKCKSGTIDQVTLGDRRVGHPWSISMFKLHLLWSEF